MFFEIGPLGLHKTLKREVTLLCLRAPNKRALREIVEFLPAAPCVNDTDIEKLLRLLRPRFLKFGDPWKTLQPVDLRAAKIVSSRLDYFGIIKYLTNTSKYKGRVLL